MKGMLQRAIRAARFDRTVFVEVRQDEHAVLNSLGIVVLAGIAIAVGMSGGFGPGIETAPESEALADRLLGIWFAVISLMVGWILWAGVILLMGKVFMHGGATYREIVRVVGLAFAPGLLFVFMAIEPAAPVIFTLITLWSLAIGIMAVHETQEVDWLGAGLAGFTGWFVCFLLIPAFVLSPFFSTPA